MAQSNIANEFQKIRPHQVGIEFSKLISDLELKYCRDSSSELIGVSTGFTDLDYITSGLRPDSLVVIASRPAMGKTTLALNMASHVALEQNLPVVFFSMGTSARQIAQMLVSHNGKVNCHSIQTGRLENDEWTNITVALEKLKDVELYIDETPALTVDQITSRSQAICSQLGGRTGLIVIDDLQCISPINSGKYSPKKMDSVMSSLKYLGKQLHTPVILLTNLTRALEYRNNKRPRFSDLPAVQVGQYADLLMFIYRDECYNPDSPHKGTAEINIDRNRYGRKGLVSLSFSWALNSFYNFDYISFSSVD